MNILISFVIGSIMLTSNIVEIPDTSLISNIDTLIINKQKSETQNKSDQILSKLDSIIIKLEKIKKK